MDSDLVTESLPDQEGGGQGRRPLFRYTERFEEVFPYYLSIGMTPEQFWDGDCTLVCAYREAHDLQLEEQNYMMWVQGRYIYDALGRMAPYYRAFKPSKPKKYMEEPIPVTARQVRKKKAEDERRKAEETRARFRAMIEQWNIRFLAKQTEQEQEEDEDGTDGRPDI